MKKTRFIAMALVIAVVLMGAGYAYWTDSIQIDNTVTTGKFDMKFEKIKGDFANDHDNISTNKSEDYVGNPYGSYQAPNGKELVTGNDQVTIPADNGNTIKFAFTNFYPGAEAQAKFKIVNNGSVPAKLESLDYDNLEEEDLTNDKLEYRLNKIVLKNPGETDVTILNAEKVSYSLDGFIEELNNQLGNQVIQPEGWIEINGDKGYDIIYPLGTAADNTTENSAISFDIEMTWKQWNAK